MITGSWTNGVKEAMLLPAVDWWWVTASGQFSLVVVNSFEFSVAFWPCWLGVSDDMYPVKKPLPVSSFSEQV